MMFIALALMIGTIWDDIIYHMVPIISAIIWDDI